MLPVLLFLGAPALAEDITLQSLDGTTISAHVEHGEEPRRGVILVHDYARHGGDWRFFQERLARSNLEVIAPTLRGHGEVLGEAFDALTDDDYRAMLQDVQASATWLREQGITDIACVGGGFGANLCLSMAASDPGITNLVLLSPGLNSKGFNSVTAIKNYGERPLLMVASIEDKYGTRTVETLDPRVKGQLHIELLDGAGSGVKMLNREPTLVGTVQSWVLGTFELADGEFVIPRPATQEEVEQVETTGDKLGIHK